MHADPRADLGIRPSARGKAHDLEVASVQAQAGPAPGFRLGQLLYTLTFAQHGDAAAQLAGVFFQL